MITAIRKIFRFYVEGFRGMTVGRTLWAIILLKLFVIFVIIKLLFMPSQLGGKSPEERSRTVMEQLTPAQ